jgi:hypothetical protein
MAANRWNIITLSVGGAVLLLMLLASSFSLGVYVGEHGWTRDGLSYSNPGGANRGGAVNPPAQGGFPQGGPVPAGTQPAPQAPAGLPQGRPNLTGRVLRLQPQSIQIAAPDGSAITLKDLQKGDVIAVYGMFTGGDGGELRADFIIRLPPKE